MLLTFVQINSPLAKGVCSAYEGQVIVHIQYPIAYDKGKFEDEIRELLSANGRSLFAWEKLTDGEIGTFVLVAEFFDASHAKAVVQEWHGKVIGVSDIFILYFEHRLTGKIGPASRNYYLDCRESPVWSKECNSF